ncbi:testis-expressed protein 26-like isoform X2 [Acanthopagrus latus]|uniref:testis-expressed protein 26-like isoform X2 n=1 Tax=Acanthopagrus latus TaxID=8177 RepID=UPI00187CB4AC|nr:testis-expressed protein 26-like isoform X2 [Acanthopagrus latus]
MEIGTFSLHGIQQACNTREQNCSHRWQPKGRQWWDPYETSNRRQFIYRPNSAAEILLCPRSTSFIDSYSQSQPFGSTVYNKDFYWKPACKPECIRTGTASGQRRNNPHPSQSFMMWRLPRDAAPSSEYVAVPWKCLPSEAEIRKALTAQYRSTYRCDFMGMPQGCDRINSAERRLTPKHSRREVPPSTDTEMRDNYRQPRQKPELLPYRHDTASGVTCRGIVPTVLQGHAHTHQTRSDLTNSDRFCGKRVTRVRDSLPPPELQQSHRALPEEGRDALKKTNREEKVEKLPAVVVNSRTPERISSWPGPA